MRRFLPTTLALAILVSAVGCGSNLEKQNESSSDNSIDTSSSYVSEASESSASYSSQEEEDTSDQACTEKTADEDMTLYEAFMYGTAKVKYRSEGDKVFNTPYHDIMLEADHFYSFDEILETYTELGFYNDGGKPKVTTREIDCGKDGNPELLIEIEYGVANKQCLVIKEIDGELVLCLALESGDRYGTTVNDDGTIDFWCRSNGVSSYYNYYYIDANGDLIFYYGYSISFSLDYLLKDFNLNVEGLDIEHIGVKEYYFIEDYEPSDEYCVYFIMDDDYNDISTDADYADSSQVKQRFDEAGVRICSPAQMEQMIKERAEEIGYPDR